MYYLMIVYKQIDIKIKCNNGFFTKTIKQQNILCI